MQINLYVKAMKITALLLSICFTQAWATAFSQQVSLRVENAPLTEVIQSIRQQSGYAFLFDAAYMQQAKPVTLSVQDMPIQEALKLVFKDQPFTYSIQEADKAIVIKEKGITDKVKDFFGTGGRATDEGRGVPSQDGKTLTGRVTDFLGTPLANATVRVKGTSRATFTNKNGEFILRGVEDNATLQISYLGFATREVSVSDHLSTIVLQRAEASLDEVDVVSNGYQVLSKERGTAAFDKVGQKLLERKISSDIISRIENLTPGVYFDKKYSENFTVRGISTLTSQIATPLIILDNFPYDGDLKNINPNDIQAITILKDGAATSIWGARAGNGVIVITTKKGQYQSKSQLTLSSSVNVTEKPDLFAAKQISTSEFIDVEQFLFGKGFFDDALGNTRRYPILSPVVQILNTQRNGVISADSATRAINSLRKIDVRNDYLKYLYRTNIDQQYALNFSGGEKTINYYLSGGYDKSLANLVGNQYERFTFRNQTTYKPTDKLDINISLQYAGTRTQNKSIGGSVTQLRNYNRSILYPYARLKDTNGNNANISQDYSKAFTDTAGAGKLLDWNYNPLNELTNNDKESNNKEWLINFGSTYKITKFLSIEGRYQYESSTSIGYNYHNLNSYYTRNLINQYTQIGASSVYYPIPMGGIMDRSSGRIVSHLGRTQLNFLKELRRDKLAVIAGLEIKQSETDYNSDRLYGYDNNTLTFANNIDYLGYYRSYDNLNFTNSIPNPIATSQYLNRFVSMYANVSYYLNSKFIVSGSSRKDQSNLFGVKTNQKGVPLWSAGGAWIISNQNFYKSDLLPVLKIRYTYGRSGNVNNGISALPTLLFTSIGSFRYTNLPFATINSYSNPSLRWEQVSMHNLGLDFGFKNQIITGYIEYYYKKSRDLISSAPTDIVSSGTQVLVTNNAALKGHGFDVNINAHVGSNAFSLISTLNLSYNKTVVDKYLLKQSYPSAYVTGNYTSPIEGANIYDIIAYKWGGLDAANGDPQGYVEGKLSKDYSAIINKGSWEDLVRKGSSMPMYFGSWINSIRYKSFSLSVNISYKFDYVLRKNSINYSTLFNGGIGHSDYEKRWQTPGDEQRTNVPSMAYPVDNNRDAFYANSEVNIIKGDHIRIQDCNLSYNLNNRLAKSISLSGLQVYSYINNIGIIWRVNKDRIDPDTPDGIRAPRSIGFGIRGGF
ncbi:TonB-linked outer membrane protein, SusC/RagA family [bacterium A37T11]|nr:TonB-linked outer membrane protein, SusC/RagA family [bacterium A37T11]